MTNRINNKIYIGQTRTLEERQYRHKYDAISNKRDTLFCRAIRKYGFDTFELTIKQKCNSLEALNKAERKWIKKLKSNDNKHGYNLTSGGEKGKEVSEHTKAIASKNRKGMKLNKEWVENIRQSTIKRSKDKKYRQKLSENIRQTDDKAVIKIFKLWHSGLGCHKIAEIIKFNYRTVRDILKKKPKYMKKFSNLKAINLHGQHARPKTIDDAWRLNQAQKHGATLIRKDIIKIFKLHRRGKNYPQIAEIIGVARGVIGSVIRKDGYVFYSRDL